MQGFFIAAAEAAHLVLGLRRLEEDDVGALRLEIAAARQRLVEAVHRARIGPRHDQDVGIGAGVHRGADFHPRLLARDHLLAAGVAAFLRADLILDHHAGGAGPGIFDHRALDVERVAIAGVAVADHRDLSGAGTAVAQAVQHLSKRNQPGVRQARAARPKPQSRS